MRKKWRQLVGTKWGLGRQEDASDNNYPPRITKKVLLPSNIKQLEENIKKLTTMSYGSDVPATLTVRVLKFAFKVKKDHLFLKEKKEKLCRKPPAAPDVRQQVTQTFGISQHTYSDIMHKWFNENTIHTVAREGNPNKKKTRVKATRRVAMDVRRFVRSTLQ